MVQTSVRRFPVAVVLVLFVVVDLRHQSAPPPKEAPAARPPTLRQRNQVQPGQTADRGHQRANTVQAGHDRQTEHHQGAVDQISGRGAGRRTAVRAHSGRPGRGSRQHAAAQHTVAGHQRHRFRAR